MISMVTAVSRRLRTIGLAKPSLQGKRDHPVFGVRRETKRHAALDSAHEARPIPALLRLLAANPKRRRRLALPAHSKSDAWADWSLARLPTSLCHPFARPSDCSRIPHA